MRIGRIAALIGVVLAGTVTGSLTAQKYSPPTDVKARASATSVSVTWAPPSEMKGVTYRVLRGTEPAGGGADVTKPTTASAVEDGQVVAGMTYYYQVIAVYEGGGTGTSKPVSVTIPAAVTTAPVTPPAGGVPITGKPISVLPGGTPGKNPLLTPTAVTGVTANGNTTASVTISWQPVTGAANYTVHRTAPSGTAKDFPGITGTQLTDNGNNNVGFPAGGVYGYQVTAFLTAGGSVTGQTTWTRPAPNCAAPAPTQAMLTVLNPVSAQFVSDGPYLGGTIFRWTLPVSSAIVGYRVEHSVQGSTAWSPAITSCSSQGSFSSSSLATGPAGQTGSMVYVEQAPWAVSGTTYQFRITALAATGDAGQGVVLWTAPNPGILRLLSANSTATGIALQWRYEPPPANAPTVPGGFKITSGYGLNQNYPGTACSGVGGCTTTVPADHKGSQTFKVTANWGRSLASQSSQSAISAILGSLSADTTIVVP